MAARQGVIDTAENMMLQEIVALPQTSVRSVMRPRVDVIAVPLDADPADVRSRMHQARLTKLPVYGRDLDDIRGLVHARDLYLRDDPPLARLIRPVNYIPEQCNLLQVIEHFQATRSQLAIAVDEYGGMAGLVTMEDVLEQIVGDLPGTQKPAEPAVEVISPNVYRLAGDLNVRDWAQRFGMTKLTGTKVQTVAGLILARLGRLPQEGESVRFANLTLTVERLAGRRIDRILLTHNPGAGTSRTTGRPEKS
jgi:CBS domain containing-hemolysin-like protein